MSTYSYIKGAAAVGGGACTAYREVSEGSRHLKCGAGSGVTRLKWILDLNEVPPECIPFGGSQGVANGKKMLWGGSRTHWRALSPRRGR